MASGKRGASNFAIFVIFFIYRTSHAGEARNAMGAQPVVNFPSGHAQTAMSLMKDDSVYDYSNNEPSSKDSIYGDHVITGVIHPISGAVPVPVNNQRKHRDRHRRQKHKEGSHLSPSNRTSYVSSSMMAPSIALKSNSTASNRHNNGKKNASSAKKGHGGTHQSPSKKNHVRTGVIHPISGAVPVPVSSQRRHKSPHRRHRHHPRRKHEGGSSSKSPKKAMMAVPNTAGTKHSGSRHQSPKNRARNTSSARKDRHQRRKHDGGRPSRSSNSTDAMMVSNTAGTKHSGGRHQSSPNRARNTSSARKENHVRTGVIHPISGAVPVPVNSQRRHKNSQSHHRSKHDGGSPSRSSNSTDAMMAKHSGGRHQNSPNRARNTSRARKDKHDNGKHRISPNHERNTASAKKGN